MADLRILQLLPSFFDNSIVMLASHATVQHDEEDGADHTEYATGKAKAPYDRFCFNANMEVMAEMLEVATTG